MQTQTSVILLAEDNMDDVFFIERALLKAKIPAPVAIVQDGIEAIAYLKGEGKYANRAGHPFPSLLILDLKMPCVDGFQVLAWVRRKRSLPHLPVIVLTGSTNPHDIFTCFQLGADSVFLKPADPFELDTVTAAVSRYLPSAVGPYEFFPGSHQLAA